jgi:2-iminobutanoate/2-iminopropanoate deaminase
MFGDRVGRGKAIAALASAACLGVVAFGTGAVVAHDGGAGDRHGAKGDYKSFRVHPHRNAYRITTDPDPYEPFAISLGHRVGNLLFISGQASLDQEGNIVGAGDFDAQAEQAFANLERVLQAGGSSLAKVVKVNIYMTDISQFPKIVELRQRFFSEPYPADTIVEVTSLALPELMIEIEAVAIVEGRMIDPGPGALAR